MCEKLPHLGLPTPLPPPILSQLSLFVFVIRIARLSPSSPTSTSDTAQENGPVGIYSSTVRVQKQTDLGPHPPFTHPALG